MAMLGSNMSDGALAQSISQTKRLLPKVSTSQHDRPSILDIR